MIDSGSHHNSCSFKIPVHVPTCLADVTLGLSATVFYLSSRTESIPPTTYCFGINPKQTGSFSTHFPASNSPYAEALTLCLPKVKFCYNQGKLEVLNPLGLGTVSVLVLKVKR